MAHILVAGLVNIETTVRVESFPLPYTPVEYPFDGIHARVSGVGFNLAKALTVLGHRVTLLSLTGQDAAAAEICGAMQACGLDTQYVLPTLRDTPRSVILYDRAGRRQIHVDLKTIQDSAYPSDMFQQGADGCDLLVLGNINFARPFLPSARGAGPLVATDVHALADLEDEYNLDFIQAADILFMSDERLPVSPGEFARQIQARYRPRLLVMGLGAQGALLGVPDDGFLGHFPAVPSRPVVNTIGAGDALMAAFLHSLLIDGDPHLAIQKALVFAGHKIRAVSAAEGFLTAEELESHFAGLRHHFNDGL